MELAIRRAARLLKEADAVLVTAGAGLGVDSGLPDFRGPEGFWRAYPPFRSAGLRFHQVSNPAWFRSDPQFAWGFWMHRIDLYRRAVPHEGYRVLRRLDQARAEQGRQRLHVFTSNVDGAFLAAGFGEEAVLECHGSVRHLQCSDPRACTGRLWPTARLDVQFDPQSFRASGPLPLCPDCSRVARTNVLMFDDDQFVESELLVQESRYRDWLKDAGSALVVVEIGAGLAVPTVRNEGELRVRNSPRGALVRINLREADVPDPRRDVALAMTGKDALVAIESAMAEQ